MTNQEKAGSSLLVSINEVLLCNKVETAFVLTHVLHELGQYDLIHLSFPIILYLTLSYLNNFGLFKSSMFSFPQYNYLKFISFLFFNNLIAPSKYT